MSDDHDPDRLDALADRILAAAATFEPDTKRLAPPVRAEARRLLHEAREGAALIQRLARDLRLVNWFLGEARMLRPTSEEGRDAPPGAEDDHAET